MSFTTSGLNERVEMLLGSETQREERQVDGVDTDLERRGVDAPLPTGLLEDRITNRRSLGEAEIELVRVDGVPSSDDVDRNPAVVAGFTEGGSLEPPDSAYLANVV